MPSELGLLRSRLKEDTIPKPIGLGCDVAGIKFSSSSRQAGVKSYQDKEGRD